MKIANLKTTHFVVIGLDKIGEGGNGAPVARAKCLQQPVSHPDTKAVKCLSGVPSLRQELALL